MKNLSTLILIVLFTSGMAWAQESAPVVAPAEAPATELPEKVPAPAATPQVIVLPAAQQPVVEQPKTTVEASPLVKSRAEQLRDARKDVEIQTEQQIVEKLEESRMKDERDRANRLFGDRFDKSEEEQKAQAEAAQVPQVPVVPVQQVVPVQTVEEDNTDEKLDAMKTEIIETVRGDLKAAKAEAKPKSTSRVYVGALAGSGEYVDKYNVDSNEAFGIVVGNDDGRFVLEGAYIYSNYFVSRDILLFNDLDQHNFMATAKYNLLNGRVKPQIGGAASYTFRQYTDALQFGGFEGAEFESTAFDVGLVLALDVLVNENFSIGVDYRYMTNVTNDDTSNTPLRNEFANNGIDELVENSDYQIFSISGKFSF